MTTPPPPKGSPFFFAPEYGLIICRQHQAAVFVDSIKKHLQKTHPGDNRRRDEDEKWAQDLPGAIRNRHEHSVRQPWKLRQPESPPLPYLPTHSGGFKCRHPQCGWVYNNRQESRIQQHCLDMHGNGRLHYYNDVCYQTFNPAFAEKDGCTYAFEVNSTRAMSRQPNLSPDAAEGVLNEAVVSLGDAEDDSEWEPNEAMDRIGDDRPSRRTATEAESSSQKHRAPPSRRVKCRRVRHNRIDSDEPLCFPKAKGSSQRDSAPQSRPVEPHRSRHTRINSDEPRSFQGRVKRQYLISCSCSRLSLSLRWHWGPPGGLSDRAEHSVRTQRRCWTQTDHGGACDAFFGSVVGRLCSRYNMRDADFHPLPP